MLDPPKLIDLFSGAGGMTRGFVDEGFTPVRAVESDLSAAATYAANFGEEHTIWAPVEEVTAVPGADVVIGGPPCQGFSNLGKRDGTDGRNDLFEQFLRVAQAAEARMFVFENVDRFRRTTHALRLAADAESKGFRTQVFSLNAADFGTAQRRVRTIIVGSRIGAISDPEPTHDKLDGLPARQPWRTVEVIRGFRFQPSRVKPPDRRVSYFGHDVPGEFSLLEIHFGRNYQDRSLERYDLIAPGRNRFDLPDRLLYECWRNHKSGSGDVLGRLEWTKPAVTIRTEFFKPEKGRYLHPEWKQVGSPLNVNRALTHAEAAVLQGFDERHVWCGSKIEIARQIGNAVPPPLAAAVARCVRHRLESVHSSAEAA
jgi:DNA (cytosine-5)-methyltransferase 1